LNRRIVNLIVRHAAPTHDAAVNFADAVEPGVTWQAAAWAFTRSWIEKHFSGK
jgi:hypothetical protein